MTHTLDIGTDLDDLLATIGELTLGSDDTATPETTVDEGTALISPKVMRGVWYR
jgi:hypothetical protein